MLLLHGAGLGPWLWDRVLPHLPLPARTLGRNVDLSFQGCVDAIVAATTPETLLVGHSFGAMMALAAATRAQAAGVILVGGVVPESGKSFLSLVPFPQRVVLGIMLRRAKDGIALPPSLVKKEYCNDLDDATTELVLSNLTREAPRLYLDPVHWSPHANTTYVKLPRDQSAKPKQQERMIARVQASRVETLDTGHLPMLAAPEQLAKIIHSAPPAQIAR